MSSGAAVVSSPSHGSESGYVFLLCDAQDIWNRKVKRSDNGGEEGSLIWHYDTVIHTCRYMVDLGRELSIPLIVSEQYPERFGGTDPRIGVNADDASVSVYAKTRFSMTPFPKSTIEICLKSRSTKENTTFVIFGVETHVCVLQTTLSLLREGAQVIVLVDGVSSQRVGDRAVALRRLEQAGAILSTAESLAMELLVDSKHPKFKAHGKLNKAFKSGLDSRAHTLLCSGASSAL